MNPTTQRLIDWLLGALTLVSLAAAVWVAAARFEWDAQYRQVSFSLTGETLLSLLDAGVPEADLTLYTSVVVDAAQLEALSPLNLKPLTGFGPAEAPISSELVQRLHDQGMAVVVALPPLPVLDAPRLEVIQAAFDDLPIQGVIFVETVLGWGLPQMRLVLAQMQPRGIWAGALEFFQPPGLLDLYREGHTDWVRAHLVPYLERLGLSREGALARYERAVRERSLRLLILNDREDPFGLVADTKELGRRLERIGFTVGAVPLPPPWAVPPWMAIALSLAVWTLTVWLFKRLWEKRVWVFWLVAGLGGVFVAWQWGRGDGGLQALALSLAILAPMWVYRRMVMRLPDRRGLSFGVGVFAAASVLTVLAGLIQAGFLSDPAYFLKLGDFRAVKLALIEPVLVIAYWELSRWGPGAWKTLWRRPLTWGDVMLGGILLAALALLLLRTGNDSPIAALPFEQALREQLEQLLYARPRFKAFLLGHPALIVWASWGVFRWGGWGIVFALVGFLGQTTILNSFAHLHTPLAFTLLRVFNGLVLGALVGALLWGMLSWGMKRWKNTASS